MSEGMKVSLCLIAKNEQHCILSCIESVKHLVHEVVVVDTGSSDDTVLLAQKAGARVFHIAWTGDFAQARNFGLEQAAGDWILVLDADEVLAPGSTEEFHQLLNDAEVEGYFLTIINLLGNGQEFTTDKVVRLFRNKPSYRFTGAIHEQVAPSILKATGGKGLVSAPVVIHHYGYLDAELAEKDKFSRNTSIIYRELAKNPGDPFLLYSLALEHFQRGQVAEGVRCLEWALSQMKGSEGYFEDVLVHTAIGLWGLENLQRLLDFLNNSLSMLPEQGDLLLIRGMTFLTLKQYAEAAGDLVHAFKTGSSKLFPQYKILCLAGDAFSLSGDFIKAEENYLSALRMNTHFLYPLLQLIGLIQRGHVLLDCDRLARFCSLKNKDSLWRDLLSGGGMLLALIVLLLEIYHLAVDPDQEFLLWQLSGELVSLVEKLDSLPARKPVHEYISVASREIHAYALIIDKGYQGRYFCALDKMKDLVIRLLLMFMRECCPQWEVDTPKPAFIRSVER